MNDHDDTDLTDRGMARREALRQTLITTMRRHHHARRQRNRAVAGGALIITAAGLAAIIHLTLITPAPDRAADDAPLAHRAASPDAPHSPESDHPSPRESPPATRLVETVSSSPSRTEIIRTRPLALVEMTSDDELLKDLAEMGRPSGLVRINHESWLLAPNSESMHHTP